MHNFGCNLANPSPRFRPTATVAADRLDEEKVRCS